jgi:hypothetical protein
MLGGNHTMAMGCEQQFHGHRNQCRDGHWAKGVTKQKERQVGALSGRLPGHSIIHEFDKNKQKRTLCNGLWWTLH